MTARVYTAQDKPLIFKHGRDTLHFKIDRTIQVRGQLLVCGWMSGEVRLSLCGRDETVALSYHRVQRPDVTQALKLPEGPYGFSFAVATDAEDILLLLERSAWKLQALVRVTPERHAPKLRLDELARLAAPEDLQKLEAPKKLKDATTPLATAVEGYIDVAEAYGTPDSDTQVYLVTGWVLNPRNLPLYYDNVQREKKPLPTAIAWKHHGVLEAYRDKGLPANAKPGFALLFEDGPLPILTLYTRHGDGYRAVTQKAVRQAGGDALPTLRTLLPLPDNDTEFLDFCHLYAHELRQLVRLRARTQDALPDTVHAAPRLRGGRRYSVIIPLYGNATLMETQCLCFARDEEILEQAEILYCVDDPELYDTAVRVVEKMLGLYPRLPLRWIRCGANRGFAGANNLAAAHANGSVLCFCNSDCIATRPGWLGRLAAHLDNDASVGAVGCRLLATDGSIQHAGMYFSWRASLDLWLTDHPRSGCAPRDDAFAGPAEVPAVTGACLVMRASDFAAVGGWSRDYLIGDFEDSDLCFRVRERGQRVLYDPTVELTHLERQSYGHQGDGLFRRRVTLYNAFVHQGLWQRYLEETS
ncbi:MAG: glycosyltransferase family 2 protein [Desulfovibrio sp.]|nr:glycosyltransferase family 2 protein [Desulfovibrio sp.]